MARGDEASHVRWFKSWGKAHACLQPSDRYEMEDLEELSYEVDRVWHGEQICVAVIGTWFFRAVFRLHDAYLHQTWAVSKGQVAFQLLSSASSRSDDVQIYNFGAAAVESRPARPQQAAAKRVK